MALKNNLNIKIVILVGIVLAAVVIAAIILTSNFNNSDNIGNCIADDVLSGKYTATISLNGDITYNDKNYLEFSDKNNFKLYSSGQETLKGTYTVNGNTIILDYTEQGNDQQQNGEGFISDDRNEIKITGMNFITFVKKS
jgi:hypothetical protein